MPHTRRTCRTAPPTLHVSSVALEALESRVVLAATEVAAVGLSLQAITDNGIFSGQSTTRAYALFGSVSDADILSYRMRWDGASGPLAPTPVRAAPVRLGDTTFDYENPRWQGLGSELGSQFLPHDGYTMGWWRAFTQAYDGIGDTPYVSHSEQQLIVPLAGAMTPLSAVQGTWQFSMLQHDTETGAVGVHTGTIGITLANRRVVIFDTATNQTLVDATINSGTGGSRFTTNAGQQFYLSADGSTLVFADLASGDGDIHVGVAVRVEFQVDAAEVAGSYNVLASADASHPQTSFITLNLSDDGTYTLEGGGGPLPAGPGTWFVHNNQTIVMRPDGGDAEQRFVLSSTSGTLLHASSAGTDRLFAVGNRAVVAPLPNPPALGVPSIGSDGQGLVFIDRAHTPWTVADVAAESGGPASTGQLVTWFDKRTGLARAAAPTDRGLTIYSELSNGAWTYNVLGESLGTGTILQNSIALTTGPGGSINIVGLSTDGDLIRYVLPQIESPGWNEWNISENQLEWRGLSTPQYIGRIVATGTSWGGLNIAGIDSNGDLVTVWTSLTAGRWYISNLSTNAGVASPLTGLDVVAAGARGIHFSAINSFGKITIVSWKPGDAFWSASTLDASPTMQHDEMSIAFDRRTTSLYIATTRLDSGAVVLHTVSLLMPPPTTPWVTVSGFGVPMEQRVQDVLDVRIDATGLISVLGINPDGETTRFTSLSSLETDWEFENITDIAT